MRPRRFFPGFNRDNRIRGPELSREREEERSTPPRREEATRFLRLFERPNCVLLLLMSTGSTTGGEGGGERRKRKENEKTGRDNSTSRGYLNCARGASRQ